MIDVILAGLALAVSAAGQGDGQAPPAQVAANLAAEPQTPTGQFTTATEVRPILQATRASWVAVREFNGRDLVYVTQLLSWRCGLRSLRFAVNDGPLRDWPLPPCHIGTAQPNALRGDDGLPYVSFPPGSVHSLVIELVYDDLGTDSARYERAQVLMR